MEEVYTAQRERDEAVMARLKLANEERDEALLRAKHLEQSLKEYVYFSAMCKRMAIYWKPRET